MDRDRQDESTDPAVRMFGLQEFGLPKGRDSIPITELPRSLGLTGCTKLVAMIGAVLVVAFYGVDLLLNTLGDGVEPWIPVKWVFWILIPPALLAAFLAAKCLDVIFTMCGIGRRD